MVLAAPDAVVAKGRSHDPSSEIRSQFYEDKVLEGPLASFGKATFEARCTPKTAATGQGRDARCSGEVERLAETFHPRISCRHGAQEAETAPRLGKDRRRQDLSDRFGKGIEVGEEDVRATLGLMP